MRKMRARWALTVAATFTDLQLADAIHSDELRFGFRRFQAAVGISLFAVSIQFLMFLVPGIINRHWVGEMGGYFVIPAIFGFCAIIGGGWIIWIFGFEILRSVSRLIYVVFAPNRVGFAAWDRVFCRSLWPLPWVFGIGAVVYIAYYAAGWGGWPDDVLVGTIGNILGAICYGTLFINWYRLCKRSPRTETEQVSGANSGQA